MYRITKLLSTIRPIKFYIKPRLFTKTSKVSGGAHHGEAKNCANYFWFPEEAKFTAKGYCYREIANMQGTHHANKLKVLLSFAWWWILYSLWTRPEDLFGHMEYPDTKKWTDAELGIPYDNE